MSLFRPNLALVLAVVVILFKLSAAAFWPVKTTSGKFYSSKGEVNGTYYFLYAGIPYAEPPIGPLRFSDPVAKLSPNEEFNASGVFGPSCPQDIATIADAFSPEYIAKIPDESMTTSEDCLTLNVYTTKGNTTEGNTTEGNTRAVFVWFHGGSYRNGQGSGYDGSFLATKGNIIVVTANYRLGALGFLYSGDGRATGNYGLKDQRLVLKWVQENIWAFGGDPRRVTVGGQADVHGSASLHMFTNSSQPLFQRIVQHGRVWTPMELNSAYNANRISTTLGRMLGCYSSLKVDCLRNKSVDDILKYSGEIAKNEKQPYIWHPIDDSDSEWGLFTPKSSSNYTYEILSVTSTGAGSICLELIQNLFSNLDLTASLAITDEQWTAWLSDCMSYQSPVLRLAITREYTDRDIEDQGLARVKAVADTCTDSELFQFQTGEYGSLNRLRSQGLTSATYAMIFDYRSWTNDRFPELDLVPHGEELSYVFGVPFGPLKDRFTDEERDLSYRIIAYWSNFIKTGDPNIYDQPNNYVLDSWPLYGDDETYLLVNNESTETGQAYHGDGSYFFNKYIGSLDAASLEECDRLQVATETPPEIFVGEGLGLKLTTDQAGSLIEVLIFVIVALLILLSLISGFVCGYRVRAKSLLAAMTPAQRMDVENGTGPADVRAKTQPDIKANGVPRRTCKREPGTSGYNSPASTINNGHSESDDDDQDEAGPIPNKSPTRGDFRDAGVYETPTDDMVIVHNSSIRSLEAEPPVARHDSPPPTHDSPPPTHDSPPPTHDSPPPTRNSPPPDYEGDFPPPPMEAANEGIDVADEIALIGEEAATADDSDSSGGEDTNL